MTLHDRLHRSAMLCGALAVFLGALAPTAAPAQQPAPPAAGDTPAPLDLPPLPHHKPDPGEKFGDWAKRCESRGENKEPQCFLSQVLVMNQNNKRRGVLAVAVGYYGPQKTPGVIMRVPLGLGTYLPAGLLLNVPGAKPVRVIVEHCLPAGCTAVARLEPEMITAMQKATRGSVQIVRINRQKIALPVSFKGFTAGFAALGNG